MKRCCLPSIALSISLLAARAVAAPTAPADTLRGQARLTRIISTDLCTKLAQESQTQNLAKLTADESTALLTRLAHQVMAERKKEVDAFMVQASATNQGIGQQMSRNALLQLVEDCPAAAPVAALLRARLAKASPKPIDPERQLLVRFIVPAACQILSQAIEAESSKGKFKKLSPAARQDFIKEAVLAGATPHGPALRRQYGEQVLNDPQQRDELSRKILALLPTECLAYRLLSDGDAHDPVPPDSVLLAPRRPAADRKN